jgi:hypothetical protein
VYFVTEIFPLKIFEAKNQWRLKNMVVQISEQKFAVKFL